MMHMMEKVPIKMWLFVTILICQSGSIGPHPFALAVEILHKYGQSLL